MGGLDSITNMLGSNKRNIEMLLTGLIVVSLMPNNILGMNIKSQLSPIVDPIQGLMRHNIVQFLIFLLLIYSCCWKTDMNMFVILCIFLLSSR